MSGVCRPIAEDGTVDTISTMPRLVPSDDRFGFRVVWEEEVPAAVAA